MVEVKGSAISGRVAFIKDRYGELAWKRVESLLSQNVRSVIGDGILASGWYPLEVFVELMVEADRDLGDGDLGMVREMARYSADMNLPTLYKSFYKEGSPDYFIRHTAQVWNVMYTSGSFEVSDVRGGVRCRIVDFETPHRAHCISVFAWAERSVEISGGTIKSARELSCASWRGSVCEYELLWEGHR